MSNTLEESMQTFVQQEYLGANETEISKSWDYNQISVKKIFHYSDIYSSHYLFTIHLLWIYYLSTIIFSIYSFIYSFIHLLIYSWNAVAL